MSDLTCKHCKSGLIMAYSLNSLGKRKGAYTCPCGKAEPRSAMDEYIAIATWHEDSSESSIIMHSNGLEWLTYDSKYKAKT